jgi:putative membrane protein
MIAILVIGVLVLLQSAAVAHGVASDAHSIATVWTYDPWIVSPLFVSAMLYIVGSHRLWRRAGNRHGVPHWQRACFWLGWIMLAMALLSPLHWLGERLFVAHMVEHEMLMVVAAPLLAVARPVGALLWGLPWRWRRGFGRAMRDPLVERPWQVLTDPWVATTVHAAALWSWHLPWLYDQVLSNVIMHRLQHISFFVSAVLFWWPLFYGKHGRCGYGVAVACLFFTSLHSAVLGIFLTLSRQLWYPQQGIFAEICGLTPLEDQQLAGLVMWVPPGFIYLGVALFFAARWISNASHGSSPGERHAISTP